ncbi:MAG TPA: hypothetical protein VFM58_15055 [Solirubrobacteraceae bacterium]|nr:hypothetical protein [Solirubrobacteraceae bacterium]
MRAEIHVPISPTAGFFMRVQMLAASLRRFGGALADSPVIVTVSRDCEPYDLAAALPWSERLGVSWRWMAADDFERHGIYGTALMRFTYDFQAPFVVMLDADTLVTGPLDDLLELEEAEAFGGVIADVSPMYFKTPFADGVGRGGQMFWLDLYELAGLPAPASTYEHLAWGLIDTDPERRFCPAYFNLGMLAAPAAIARRIGDVVLADMARVDQYLDTNFKCQLAVALSLVRTQTPALPLAAQWNFPNNQDIADRNPEDAADVRILHYRKREEVGRDTELTSLDGIDGLLRRRGLLPVNTLLQERIAAVRADLEPVLADA